MTRPLTRKDLDRAAEIAREKGVAVSVECDGKVYTFTPAPKDKSVNPADLVDMPE